MSYLDKKMPFHLKSSQNRLLIKNGTIVSENKEFTGDIYIEDGKIKEIGHCLVIPGGVRMINAKDCYVIPGGIDPHTHFSFDFMNRTTADDFYEGTRAAINGGTTTIIDFVFPEKGDNSLITAFEKRRNLADSKVCCDYSLHGVITSWTSKTREQMEYLLNQHGVSSFKMFMAYDFAVNDEDLYSIFESCKQLNILPMVHAESGKIVERNVTKLRSKDISGPIAHQLSRPEEVEADAIFHAAVIAKQVESPLYVVHVMSKFAAEIVKLLNDKWGSIQAETVVAAIGTDGSHYYNEDYDHSAGHVMSPPLRLDSTTSDFLINFLNRNELKVLSSDHCTFTKEQKRQNIPDFSKIPNGVNGVEERMMVLWQKAVKTELMPVTQFVNVTSTNAAKIFGLYPKKGVINVGSDADIVVWDPSTLREISAKKHQSKSNFNIFEGLVCHGAPKYVIVKGRVCVEENDVKVVAGLGSYVNRLPILQDHLRSFEVYNNGSCAVDKLADDLKKAANDVHIADNHSTASSFHGNGNDDNMTRRCMKGPRLEGQRNMQDTTFSINGDDNVESRTSIRVHNPPGGESTGFW